MGKGVLFYFGIFMILLIAVQISASSIENNVPVQIQTTDASGNIITGTFIFAINISNSSTCSPVLYSDSRTKTTDSRGIVSYNLENVDLDFNEQYWFCYYRDGVLKEALKIGRMPYSFRAKNTTLSGIEVDKSLDMGSYNITAAYLFGNGSQLTGISDSVSDVWVNESGDTMTGNLNLSGNNLTDVNTGFFDWLGSLSNGITKLFAVDVNVSNNIDVGGNVSASYFIGDGSQLTGIVASNTAWNRSGSNVFLAITGDNVGIGTTVPLDKMDVLESDGNASNVMILRRGTQTGGDQTIPVTFGKPLLKIGGTEWRNVGGYSFYGIGFGYGTGSTSVSPAEIGFKATSLTGGSKGDLVFGLRDTTTASDIPVERMRITSAGKVGIGTVSPGYFLTLNSSSPTLAIQRSGTLAGKISSGDQLVTGGATNSFALVSSENLYLGAGANVPIITITSTGGKVGIGTETPSGKLEVSKQDSTAYQSNWGSYLPGRYDLVVSNSIPYSSAGSSGNYTSIFFEAGTTAGVPTGTINLLDSSSYGADFTFQLRQASSPYQLAEMMRITGSGRVGIGTTTPNEKLEVIGNANITGNLSLGKGKIMFNDTSKSYYFYNGSVWGSMSGGGVPAGAIMAFNSETCPTGWIPADGTSGTPDLQGLFIRGAGTNSQLSMANGTAFSATFGTYQNDSFQGHNHSISPSTAESISTSPSTVPAGSFRTQTPLVIGNPTNSGYGEPRYGAETRPAAYVLTYCMKTTEDTITSNTIWGESGGDIVPNNVSKNVHLYQNLTVDGSLTVSDSCMWHYVENPDTGWLGSKTSGWTSDSFSGGLTVNFSSVVPEGTKAVRISVYVYCSSASYPLFYWRKYNDGNISNTPNANQEYSHLGGRNSAGTAAYDHAQLVVYLSSDYQTQFAVSSATGTSLYVSYPIEYCK